MPVSSFGNTDGYGRGYSYDIRDVVTSSLNRGRRIPRKGKYGYWTGQPGNSTYRIDPALVNGSPGLLDLLTERNIWSIQYVRGEPIFFPFMDKNIGKITLPFHPMERTSQGGSYYLADQQYRELFAGKVGAITDIKQYMAENELVWHECGDGITVIAIPVLINRCFAHTGGIAINRSYRVVTNYIGRLTHKRWKLCPGNERIVSVESYRRTKQAITKKILCDK